MSIDAPAIEAILNTALRERRDALFEHEVYRLLQAAGIESAPTSLFRPTGVPFTVSDLQPFAGQRVVLKIVAAGLAHKSDIGGVRFVPNDVTQINRHAAELISLGERTAHPVAGVLCCECIEHAATGLGQELYVGVRATRQFGPIIVAGLGGAHTEYLASTLNPAKSIAMAPALLNDAQQFFKLFRATAAYDFVSGAARGFVRQVSDEALINCFQAFIALARNFSNSLPANRPNIAELEVNPFAVRDSRLVPLDGLCRLEPAPTTPASRPVSLIDRLLHPKSMAIIGVSAKSMNMGRVILQNVVEAGFHPSDITIIKPNQTAIDGVTCVATLADLPTAVDLLVVAVDAAQAPSIAEQATASGKIASVILIPGGMGETTRGQDAERRLRDYIAHTRISAAKPGPIFLGGNCLGVRSRPGRYDTMFIPENKLAKHSKVPPRPVAIISQSGAFVVSKLSNLETLHPAYAISLGNQIDLTVADVLQFLEECTDLRVFGVYVEGFRDGDGLAAAKTTANAAMHGKDVIFYKAGRTEAGKTAAAGHTASIAGDYNVCTAAMSAAGALVAESFKDFEHLLQLAACMHGRNCAGTRLAGITNAGYEAVGMADASLGPDYAVQFAPPPEVTAHAIRALLSQHRLDGLVNLANPLDLTPMATDAAHYEAIRIMLGCDAVDAVVASFVPLTPTMQTTPSEIEDPASLAQRLPELLRHSSKPLIVSIDAGAAYNALAQAISAAGIPVFRSVDVAVRTFGRYLQHKVANRPPMPQIQPAAMTSHRS